VVQLDNQVYFMECDVKSIAVSGKSWELADEKFLNTLVGKDSTDIGESTAMEAILLWVH